MNITIVVPDKTMIVDGFCIFDIDMTGLPENLKVVQFNETDKQEEFTDSPTIPLASFDKYQFMLDRFNIKKAAIDNENFIQEMRSTTDPYFAMTPEEKQVALYNDIIKFTQKRLDDFAQTRNYDGILSAASYATSTNLKFQIEGQYCVDVRDLTWAKLYEILAEIHAGTRQAPNSFSDIESELPVLSWPV